MKCWRNSEGREFPKEPGMDEPGAIVRGRFTAGDVMREFGYELVDSDPEEEFEAQARQGSVFYHPRLIPGETYSVRKVKR